MSLKEVVRDLSPAYFALVMATGIVSIASEYAGFRTIAVTLLWLNIGQYLILCFLTLWRLLCYRREWIADLLDHRTCVGFFTIVAGTSGFGDQTLKNQRSVTTHIGFLGAVV